MLFSTNQKSFSYRKKFPYQKVFSYQKFFQSYRRNPQNELFRFFSNKKFFSESKVLSSNQNPETSKIYEAYSGPRSIYYVLERQGEILGGVGIRPLKNFDDSVCKFQKIYSLPKIRGRGFGQKLLNRCLESVQKFRFECCSIGTIESLQNPVILYKCSGFFPIGCPIENTGHHNCGSSILKKLQ